LVRWRRLAVILSIHRQYLNQLIHQRLSRIANLRRQHFLNSHLHRQIHYRVHVRGGVHLRHIRRYRNRGGHHADATFRGRRRVQERRLERHERQTKKLQNFGNLSRIHP